MTSPHEGITVNTSPKGLAVDTGSPKGGAQCLCSPTTHQGSFRCRFHRPKLSAWMKRSNSMPTQKTNSDDTAVTPSSSSSSSSISPKSIDQSA